MIYVYVPFYVCQIQFPFYILKGGCAEEGPMRFTCNLQYRITLYMMVFKNKLTPYIMRANQVLNTSSYLFIPTFFV